LVLLQAQRDAKEKKELDNKDKALEIQMKKNEIIKINKNIMDEFLISFDRSTASLNPHQWKTNNANILKVVYKSFIGVGNSNLKKVDPIEAILPKLEERRLLGTTSLMPEEMPQEVQDIHADNAYDDEDLDDF
jgi:hypothetical protein